MLRHGCSFVAATVLFAVAATAGEAIAHPPIFTNAESERRAEELRKQGNALSREGRLADAVEAYASSFKINETYAAAANLGSLELKLEHYRDAAEHLAFALRMSPPDAKPAVTEALNKALAEAKTRVGALKIHVTPDNADVAIDGRAIDWIDLAFEVYVGGATAGTVLGVVFTILANGKSSEAAGLRNTLRASAGDTACEHPAAPTVAGCGLLYGDGASQSLFANTALWSFIAGGAFALGMGTYALWPTSHGTATPGIGVTVLPTFGAGSGGVVVVGEL